MAFIRPLSDSSTPSASSASPVAAAPLTERLAPSLAVLGVPLACQLAAGFSGHVPDGLWLLLVLSIWAALTGGALLVLTLCGACARALDWLSARRQARPRWHHGVVAGCPAFSASAARSASRRRRRWS